MRCSQCGKPSIGSFGPDSQPLCVEHYTMLSNAINEQQRNSMAMQNALRAQIYNTVGLPVPQETMIDIPRPVVSRNPVTYNNIHINKSVVGSVNTAQVGRIDVALDNIQIGGNEEISNAIKTVTEAVIKNTELKEQQQTEILQELAFLAEQATLPKEQRQTKVVNMVLKSLPVSLSVVANLATVWATWGGTLKEFFK